MHACVITRMRGGMCTMSAMFKDNAFDIKHLLDSLNSIMLAILLGNKYNKSCGNRVNQAAFYFKTRIPYLT